VLAFCGGCNDFLDTVPDNRTEIDTEDKISMLLTSAYPKANYAMVANVMGDGMGPRRDYTGQGSDNGMLNEAAYYWEDTPLRTNDSPYGVWNGLYAGIAVANHALAAIEAMPNPQKLKNQRAEALLCRAFGHFLLVNLFAKTYVPGEANSSLGIPYADRPEDVVFDSYSRGTVQGVYERIEQDLEEALKTPLSEGLFTVPAYHFTERAAHAFASRFYLYKGEYQKAIDHATAVVPRPVAVGKNVPETDPANVWASANFAAFKEWGTVQTDIANEWKRASNRHNVLLAEHASDIRVSTLQYGLQQTSIPSGVNITGGRWPWGSWHIGDCYVLVRWNGSGYFYYTTTTTGIYMVMFPFLRSEEIILNRIEASIMLDRDSDVVNDFNVYFRQRSGITQMGAYDEVAHVLDSAKIMSYWAKDAANESDNFLNREEAAFNSKPWKSYKKALMLTLLDTRMKEFLGEGMRWFDILRYKIPVTHLTPDGSTVKLPADDPRRLWQLPESAVNQRLEANPR
jgi:hypothetical protein